MMYFLLILFFGSLLGIIIMIGRKLIILQNGQILHHDHDIFKFSSIEELKHTTTKNIKKYSYTGLILTIRLYVRGTNFLKNSYDKIKSKIKNIRGKKLSEFEKQEVSGFLKMIGEYKQKIREIKHKIKEEENL